MPLGGRRLKPMPTLFRLFVVLLILTGLVVGAMVALTVFVDPQPGEVVVRIPARDLFANE